MVDGAPLVEDAVDSSDDDMELESKFAPNASSTPLLGVSPPIRDVSKGFSQPLVLFCPVAMLPGEPVSCPTSFSDDTFLIDSDTSSLEQVSCSVKFSASSPSVLAPNNLFPPLSIDPLNNATHSLPVIGLNNMVSPLSEFQAKLSPLG